MSKKIKWGLIINLALILIVGIYYAVEMSVISIAAVAAHQYELNTIDVDYIIKLNHTFNLGILIEFGLYSILQLANFITYLYQNKKIQYVLFGIDIILVIYSIIRLCTSNISTTMFIFFIPLISNFIYLAFYEDEQKPKKKKKNRKKGTL